MRLGIEIPIYLKKNDQLLAWKISRKPLEEPMTTFAMLPNDMVLNCLARISRLYYPNISIVSKRFRSLLASIELYQTRDLLCRTETCLYVCLELPTYYCRHWFTLCGRSNSSKKVLVPITSPNSPSTYQSDFARVGSKIYAIGGNVDSDNASPRVMVMDCRSHTWSDAPSMLVARETPSVCVLDGKIYVMGGCKNLDATNWMEVFDTKTQTWEFVPSSLDEKFCSRFRYQSFAHDGNVYMNPIGTSDVYKMTNKGRWRAGDLALAQGWICLSPYCVIENVLYSYLYGRIRWYDFQKKCWKELEGLENLFSFPRKATKLADYGGKLALLWDDNACGQSGPPYIDARTLDECQPNTNIFCAEIALEKRQGGTIWGTLECFDVVSTTNEPYIVGHVVAATLWRTWVTTIWNIKSFTGIYIILFFITSLFCFQLVLCFFCCHVTWL